jgi:hypothetical protein
MENTFQLKGQIWRKVYGNKEHFYRDYKGLNYIHQLLALKLSERLSATDLVIRAGGEAGDVGSPEQVKAILADLMEGNVVNLTAHRPDYLLPTKVIIALQDYLRAKEEELAQAADGAARAELADEIKKVRAYLKVARSNVRFEDRAKRDRTSVRNAIRRAIKVIAKDDEDLARHLKNSIRTGYWCSYQPERPVAWRL